MKRFLSILLILTVAAHLPSCEESDEVGYFFSCKVIEKLSEECLAEIIDAKSSGLAMGETVRIHTRAIGFSDYAAGDVLEIEFDGKVALSYPAQISRVLSIKKQ